MSKVVLGLDLGITSIGWALVDVEASEIIDSGVRIFQIAEHPKDGKSLALPRREARSARRTTKRKAQKLRAVKRLLVQYKIVSNEELNGLFIGNKKQKDVWQLRKEALVRRLDNNELARVMVHLAKHRGYFSNRKSDEPTDNEGKAVLSGISANQKMLDEGAFLTVGEYLSTKLKKRNGKDESGKLNYENAVSRSMLVHEIDTIFEKQLSYGSTLVSQGLLEAYKQIAFSQRPLKSVEGMVAYCPFETGEKRAPKASHTFEKFRALQKLKNVRVLEDDAETALSLEQIRQAIRRAKEVGKFSYKTLKTTLGIDKDAKFKGLTYFDHKTGEVVKKDPESAVLVDFSAYRKIQKTVQNTDNLFWDVMADDDVMLDEIAWILSTEKDDEKSLEALRRCISSETVCEALLGVSFSGFGHISVKALKAIVPGMEAGLDYDKACEAAGYDFKAMFEGEKSIFMPVLNEQERHEMTNPVVKRAIAQMRLVYNALARKYGALDAVHIELSREIKKSFKDRKEIEKGQVEFRERKEEARAHAVEILGKEPSAKELLKFRLWQEQNQFCVYSGERITPADLMDPLATQVDHILPYSRSLDDSLNNKVLCFTKENQEKGNKTPYEYMSAKQWETFCGRVNGLKNIKQAKKTKLLKTNFDTNSEKAFKERNKNDTSYIARFVKNFLEAHIAFRPSNAKRRVFTMNGMLTSQLRHKWGVGEKNRNSHLHHAEDAIILAFATQSEVKKLSEISAKREGMIYEHKTEKAKKLRFEPPMEGFHEAVQESLKKVFVSHMPRRKVTGAAHEETVYSPKTKSVRRDKGRMETLKGNSVTNHVVLKHGLAKNDSMPRVDLFRHKASKKYYLVPIYVSDFVKETLPNKAIVQGNKPWLEMDDDYEFLFSFYKNDLIEIKTKKTAKKESVQILGYFDGADSGTAKILLKSHDGSTEYGYGSQNLVFIKKYQVDPLGNYVEVKQEKRVGTQKELAETKRATQK